VVASRWAGGGGDGGGRRARGVIQDGCFPVPNRRAMNESAPSRAPVMDGGDF